MSRREWKALNKEKENGHVDDCVLAYCIKGQLSRSNKISTMNKDGVGPLPTTKNMRDAQAAEVLYQNYKEVLKKDRTVTVKKTDFYEKEQSLTAQYKLLFMNATEKGYRIMVTARS